MNWCWRNKEPTASATGPPVRAFPPWVGFRLPLPSRVPTVPTTAGPVAETITGRDERTGSAMPAEAGESPAAPAATSALSMHPRQVATQAPTPGMPASTGACQLQGSRAGSCRRDGNGHGGHCQRGRSWHPQAETRLTRAARPIARGNRHGAGCKSRPYPGDSPSWQPQSWGSSAHPPPSLRRHR